MLLPSILKILPVLPRMKGSLYSQRVLYHASKNWSTASNSHCIDLRSDTVTSPSEGMREAMACAITGDDVYHEDPTVNELEELMASITGKEAGLFVPSGTMGNLSAILMHCTKRGSEVILGDESHIFLYEQGGISQFGGVHSYAVPNDRLTGELPIAQIVERIRPDDIHCPSTELVCLENTHCSLGGRVLSPEYFRQVFEAVSPLNIPIHLDGARLFNAVAAHDSVPEGAQKYLQYCQSASLCLSKGIGCPVGSVVVSDAPFIARARRLRKALGGGMRQVGVLAAAALHVLRGDFIAQLKEDHENALAIAKELSEHEDLFSIVSPVESNMVIVALKEGIAAEQFSAALEQPSHDGDDVIVRFLPWSASTVRLVAHCNVSREMALRACEKMVSVAKHWASHK